MHRTQFVRPGENATFKVLVDKFQQSGPVEYHWQFNGADLPWQTEPSLTITNVQDSDAGPYAVTVSNPAGAVTTPEAMLVVQKEPPPPRLSCMHWGTNGPGFHIFGTPNVTYVIQASQDFGSWSDISTNTAPEDGKFEFVDPDDITVLADAHRGRRRVHDVLPVEDHVVGREGLAVVPRDVLLQPPGH